MNTPKLISILTGSVGHVDPARAGRAPTPSPELDFSQLLGERRGQSAPSTIAARPGSERHAGDRTDRGVAPRTEAVRNSPAPAADRRESSASQTEKDAASAPSGASRPGDSQSGAGPQASAGADSAADSGGPTTETADATDATEADSGTSGTIADAGTPQVAADTVTQADAQLAQQAAIAGLAAIAAGQISQGADTVAAGAMSTPAAGAPAPAAVATSALALHAEAEVALPGNTQAGQAAPAAGLAAADALAQAATMPAQRAGASQAPAARAPGLVQADAQAAAKMPTLAGAGEARVFAMAAPQAAASEATHSPQTAATLTHLATDATSTAAARSLQEFTAMVEAARATSGTTLQPAASHAPTSVSATGFPGPMSIGPSVSPQLSPSAPPAAIAAPLGSPRWPTEFGRQFISLAQAANGVGQVAELRLDPPELGPLRITITLADNVAHAVISSPHTAVRQTVENALPQLQQMLEQAGISLGQANVNDQHQPGAGSSQGERRPGQGAAGGSATAGGAEGHAGEQANRTADPDALVDTFA